MRVKPRNLRLVRWQARAPRIAVIAAAAVLCLVGARSMFGNAVVRLPERARHEQADLGARAVAEGFARAYLTWDARHPERHEAAVARSISSELEPGAGMDVPEHGSQRVEWTVVAGDTPSSSGRHITVQAGTTRGVIALSVPVARNRQGFYGVADYPALVGQVAVDRRLRSALRDDVDEPGLAAVARRVVGNFLAGERANLLADLDGQAVVVMPGQRLRVTSVGSMTWVVRPSRVAVVVEARARGGAELTLRYELDVVRRAGRWLVRSIQHRRSGNE